MHPKLRAVVKDRILLLLVAAFLVQSYRLVEARDVPPFDVGSSSFYAPVMQDPLRLQLQLMERSISLDWGSFGHCSVPRDSDGKSISIQEWADKRGDAFEFPQQRELNISFRLPLSPDGKPIDVQLFSKQAGETLRRIYHQSEFDYGPNDPRTLKARAAHAANLLYYGDRDEALRFLRQNYDAARYARDMATDERLGLLLFSARELRASSDDRHDDRVTDLIPLAKLHAGEAPSQVAQILNAIATRYLEVDNLTMALACFGAAEELPLDGNMHKLVMIETGLGKAVASYRRGSSREALNEAKRQLISIAALQQKELLPARAFYLNALHLIFEKLGDDEYVAITEGLQAGKS